MASGVAAAMEHGNLPWPGCYMDQPARAIAAARLWNRALAAYADLPQRRIDAAGGG